METVELGIPYMFTSRVGRFQSLPCCRQRRCALTASRERISQESKAKRQVKSRASLAPGRQALPDPDASLTGGALSNQHGAADKVRLHNKREPLFRGQSLGRFESCERYLRLTVIEMNDRRENECQS